MAHGAELGGPEEDGQLPLQLLLQTASSHSLTSEICKQRVVRSDSTAKILLPFFELEQGGVLAWPA